MKDFILIFIAMFCLLAYSLTAATYSGGNGTAEDPYQIASPADWQTLMENSMDWKNRFILTADINLAGVTVTPIGDFYLQFKGIVDGNGYTISNIFIDQPDSEYVGLFGFIHSQGQIRNMSILNAVIEGERYVGGIVGTNSGIITDCNITGSVSGTNSVGGLTGYNYKGLINSCDAFASVSGTYFVGGLAGVNTNGTIANCKASGAVTGQSDVGGLVGYHWNSLGLIKTCYATGPVSGSQYAGGLVGTNDTGTIINCYATGSAGSSEDFAGGLVGWNSGIIKTCYAAGQVSGEEPVGGLVGYDSYGFTISCFWNTLTCQASSGVGNNLSETNGVKGITTAQMQTFWTFIDSGWDFAGEAANGIEEIWTLSEGISYPYFYTGSWIQILKCTVTAGKNNLDQISLSGAMNASYDDLSNADFIDIKIDSADIVNPCTITFPIDTKTFKKGKFNSKVTNGSLMFDTITRKMTLSAKNTDLSGLACPIAVHVQIGSYATQMQLNETIVNSPRKSCPPTLMAGIKNTLAVTQSRVTHGKNSNTDSFTIQGTITIDGNYNKSKPLVITLDSQTFTVDGSQFPPGKTGIESCKRAASLEGPFVDAKLDFVKCTYTITVKNTSISSNGTVPFGINCFGVSLDGLATVNIH